MDNLTPERRSWNMGRIRSGNTRPEIQVRSMLHRRGFRFRLHRRDLPGRPDIVLPKLRVAMFVHGCFWHRHADCRYAYEPHSREAFWTTKFKANVERDESVASELRNLGWTVVVVWECELRQRERLENRLVDLLENAAKHVAS